jgi:hypothetical protein
MRLRSYIAAGLLCAQPIGFVELASAKDVTIHGAGGFTCGKYVRLYEDYRAAKKIPNHNWAAVANYVQVEEWINGYVYGMDVRVFNSPPLRNWEREAMQVWIDSRS